MLKNLQTIRQKLESGMENFPEDCCEVTSVITAFVFNKKGYDSKILIGDFKHPRGRRHCFNKISKNIVDLTIDQFGSYSWGIIPHTFFGQKYCNIEEDVSTLNSIFEEEEKIKSGLIIPERGVLLTELIYDYFPELLDREVYLKFKKHF